MRYTFVSCSEPPRMSAAPAPFHVPRRVLVDHVCLSPGGRRTVRFGWLARLPEQVVDGRDANRASHPVLELPDVGTCSDPGALLVVDGESASLEDEQDGFSLTFGFALGLALGLAAAEVFLGEGAVDRPGGRGHERLQDVT